MEVKDISEEKVEDNIDEEIYIDEDTTEANEDVENPINEMCDVDEGDIRNKGNRKRKNCY